MFRSLILALFAFAPSVVVAQTKDLPGSITPDAVKRTKESTVLLKVTMGNGQSGSGSGFLAVESGVVVTNAHVVGMLQPKSAAPTKVTVVVYSGEKTEMQLTGKILGVDRVNDLAVLRVEGKLPAPLLFGVKDDLFETQKVYIFGFPFGTELGKNITVSESSVSSLRKDASGALESIQVNGGMHPGNSGGPVVNSLGEVIGVSVAVIKATQINFAIPAQAAKLLLDGRILESKVGEVFRQQTAVKVPVQYELLDPFSRIRSVQVEVWAGKPATDRPFMKNQAQILAGDKSRSTQNLKVTNGVASGDVQLPALAQGEVAWVQPVLSFTKGDSQYGAPVSFDAGAALERVPATLAFKLANQKERTIHLKSTQSLTLSKDKSKLVLGDTAELDILESFSPDAQGAMVKTGFGVPALGREEDDKKTKAPPDVGRLLQQIPPVFIVDATNQLRVRSDAGLSPTVSSSLREQVNDYLTQISNAYEAANFVLPNRQVSSRESWKVKNPMMFKVGSRGEILDLVITCTYEGTRVRSGNTEALVSFEGEVVGRNLLKGKVDGRVSGKFTFDSKLGFISTVKMTVETDLLVSGSEVVGTLGLNIDLTRVEGNTKNLQIPVRSNVVVNNPSGKEGKEIIGKNPMGKGTFPSKNPMGKGTFPGKEFPGKSKDPMVVVDPPVGIPPKNDPPENVPIMPKTKTDVLTRPAQSSAATNYLKIVSSKDEPIGQGKEYDFRGDQLQVRAMARGGVRIQVEGWTLVIVGSNERPLSSGEYKDVKKYVIGTTGVGIDLYPMGQKNGATLNAEFAVWENQITNGVPTKLAIDFIIRADVNSPPITGKIRINSRFE